MFCDRYNPKEQIMKRIGVLKKLRVWWWAFVAILFGSSVVAFIVSSWVQGVCGLLWTGTSLLNLKSNSEKIKNYEFVLDCTKEDLEHVSAKAVCDHDQTDTILTRE